MYSPPGAVVVRLAESLVDCFEVMERLSSAVPCHPARCRARTGIVCCPEFRGGQGLSAGKLRTVETCITAWLIELLDGRGFTVMGPSQRRYANGRRPDLVVNLGHRDLWIEAKPIWGDWISDGSSGNRLRDQKYAGCNISRLRSDAKKLERSHPVAGDYWGLLAIVFDWDDRLRARVIQAVGASWQHRAKRVPDLCNAPGERFGCTAIFFWRLAQLP